MTTARIAKERIVYELCAALSIDPENISSSELELPEQDDQRYNIFLALKKNLLILEGMQE